MPRVKGLKELYHKIYEIEAPDESIEVIMNSVTKSLRNYENYIIFPRVWYMESSKMLVYIADDFINPLPHGGILYPIPRRRVTIDRAQRRL